MLSWRMSSSSRFFAGSVLLAGWLGVFGFAACSSFMEPPAGPASDTEAGTDASPSAEGAAGDDSGAKPCAVADTSCNPLGCGRPGHSCLGGACVAGKCQAAILSTFTATLAYGPVLDAQRAVIVTQSAGGARVEWCPKAGCAAGPSGVDLATPPTSARSIASDGTSAYVSTVGGKAAGVFRIGQDGLLRSITPVDGTFQNADEVAIDGTDVLFLNAYQTGPIGIYRVPADGSAAATTIVPVQASDRFAHLVATPGRVYVSDFAMIATCGTPTCPALDTYASAGVTHLDITGLATDGKSLFWTSDRQELLTCALGASCAAPAVVVGATELGGSVPIGLSSHGPDLYITTEAGKIFTCTAALCGSTFKALVTDEVIEGAAVADDQAVYWLGRARIDAGGGAQAYRLMRLAK
jgi:hypothetical protein